MFSSNHLHRTLAICLVALVFLSACSEDERREIRLTPTSTVETGVRILVDNCPGPSAVQLLVRDDLLWQIDSPVVTETPADDTDNDDDADLPATVDEEPGLAEIGCG